MANEKFDILNTGKSPTSRARRKSAPEAPKPPEDAEASLGRMIRQERSRQGMTLEDLARLSGVSKGMLSQIEQSKTNPTVTVLLRIAGGLRVEPTRLLPSQAGTPRVWRTIRANEERHLFPAARGCTIRTLSPLDLEKQIELYDLELEPKAALISEPHFQGTEEILTVVHGRMEIRSGDNRAELKKGDSVHYAADVPHRITNLGPGRASGVLLVWYRT